MRHTFPAFHSEKRLVHVSRRRDRALPHYCRIVVIEHSPPIRWVKPSKALNRTKETLPSLNKNHTQRTTPRGAVIAPSDGTGDSYPTAPPTSIRLDADFKACTTKWAGAPSDGSTSAKRQSAAGVGAEVVQRDAKDYWAEEKPGAGGRRRAMSMPTKEVLAARMNSPCPHMHQ